MVMFIPTYPYLLSYLPVFLFIYAYSGSPISIHIPIYITYFINMQ